MSGISLPVGSHLDDSQARRTAKQAEDYFATAGRQAGDAFSRNVNQGLGRVDTGKAAVKAAELQRAYDKAADAAGKLRIEEERLAAVNAASNSTNSQKIAAAERYLKAQRASSRATRDFTTDLRDLERAGGSAQQVLSALSSGQDLSKLGTTAAKTAMDFGELTTSVAAFAGPIGIGALVVGAATVGVGALGMLAGAAVELTGVLGLLPGAAVAVGAAFGTMKLATMGFSDALGAVGKSLQDFHDPKKFADDQKAFAESIQSLSPNAQQAALSLNAMLPALDGLKRATQDALFAGVGQELNQLASKYLPAIQTTLVSIAGSFNQMFKGIGDQLMKPETQQAIKATLANISQAFQNLAPAMGPATKAFAEIAQVSSSFLPGLATAISNAAQHFSEFIDSASKSGQLRQWIQDGIDALKELGRLGPDLKQMFLDFKANGKTAIHDLVTVTHGLLAIIDKLGGAYHNVSGEVKAMANFTVASFNQIGSSISLALEPLRALIKVNNKINPLFDIPQIPEFKGFDLPAPGAGINPFTPKVQGNAQAESGAGTPYGPSSEIGGDIHYRLAYPVGGYAVPGMPDDGKKGKLPTVAAGNQDPMSLLQGFPATAELYGAAGTVLDNKQKVAQAQSDLNTLEKANVRDEDAIIAKKNELGRANRELYESELRLNDAKQQAVTKTLKGMQATQGDLQQLGAQLDKDFGISKGFGGIVENLVKALGNIVAAPFLQALGFVAKANPNEGSGLVGIVAANGLFGQQYTPGAIGAAQALRGGRGNMPGMAPGLLGGLPYGLAPGTNTGGYGSSGAVFPAWVHAMEQAFGVKASTYSGHQESDRNEPGYAPNPMHLNRGIDWTGSPEAMQALANYMATQPNAEQVIYDNPATGQKTESVAGQARPGYFAGDLPEHQNHVHTRQAFSIPAPGFSSGAQDATGALNGLASAAQSATQALGGPGGWSADWNAMAQKESSGNWAANTGNGYQGGLQFTPSSWNAAGGTQYAPSADQASPYQQALTAEQLLKMQGPGAWPNTFTPGSSGPAAPPVVDGGGMYPGMGMGQGLPTGMPGGSIFPAGYGPGGAPGGPGLGSAAGLTPAQPGLGTAAGIGLPAVGGGTPYPSHGGNSGNILGGMPMDAIMAATSGLDMMMPGAGAAAKIGIQVANRTIGYAAQNAGILASGLMETFSVGDNPKGSIGAGWLGKLAGGFAGAAPALPNLAGQKAPEQKQGSGQQQGADAGGGVTNNINVQSRDGASGQEHGEQIGSHLESMYAPAGRQ